MPREMSTQEAEWCRVPGKWLLVGFSFQRLSFVDVATGSLGQGLSCAAGMAYTGKYFDKAEYVITNDVSFLNV